MESHDKSNNSGNGFLIGLILGSFATLLFTTKKGREIVKDFTEKGVEKLSELQSNIDKAVVTEKVENDYLEPEDRLQQQSEPEKPKLLAKEVKTDKANTSKKESVSVAKTPRTVKRFFRLKKN